VGARLRISGENIFGYDTMAQMAENRGIDIVYVVTPNVLHAEHCIAAGKNGQRMKVM
jgi:glucose-fructose oxidoreductase